MNSDMQTTSNFDPFKREKFNAMVKKAKSTSGLERKIIELHEIMDQMTTPVLTQDVFDFASSIYPYANVRHIEVNPPYWSRKDCCKLNVAAMIKDNGGKMVLGYKIWSVPGRYIEAIPHAIWLNAKGVEIDVTFNVDGEMIVAIFDDPNLSKVHLNNEGEKHRLALDPGIEKTLTFDKEASKLIDIPFKTDDFLWKNCLKYREWKNGKR